MEAKFSERTLELLAMWRDLKADLYRVKCQHPMLFPRMAEAVLGESSDLSNGLVRTDIPRHNESPRKS